MTTIALLGPDGAGKTTLGRRLERDLGLPAVYLYMGVSAESSNRLLPTTRIVRAIRRARGRPVDAGGPPPPPTKPSRRTAKAQLRAALRLLNQLAEEWYRQILVWREVARGRVVIFDRHFFADYYADDIAPGVERTWERRIHGTMLSRLYPQPDVVVLLDAPAETLLARKGEGTLEALERRRNDYHRLAGVMENFRIVDASKPPDEVLAEVVSIVLTAAQGPPSARR